MCSCSYKKRFLHMTVWVVNKWPTYTCKSHMRLSQLCGCQEMLAEIRLVHLLAISLYNLMTEQICGGYSMRSVRHQIQAHGQQICFVKRLLQDMAVFTRFLSFFLPKSPLMAYVCCWDICSVHIYSSRTHDCEVLGKKMEQFFFGTNSDFCFWICQL